MEIKRDCICANVRRASRAVTAVYDRFLSPSDLRTTQFSLLININRLEKATITELSERMLMDKTTLTRNVRLLMQRGLVEIETGKDRRVKEIVLSKKGIDALDAARPFWEDAQKYVVEGLGKERMDQFIHDLAELAGMAER